LELYPEEAVDVTLDPLLLLLLSVAFARAMALIASSAEEIGTAFAAELVRERAVVVDADPADGGFRDVAVVVVVVASALCIGGRFEPASPWL
jgi:hypothetical protein